MRKTKIIKAPATNRGWFTTTTKSTGISQRDTLEEIIVQLSTALGVEVVHKQANSRGTYFYEVQAKEFGGFQSASNTILELSRKLASAMSKKVV